ncbi:MAG: ABC-F family ATP-binding cassette domain-containing protein [Thermodesulfobacteriota bacterium]
MLSIDGLKKSYGDHVLFDHVSFKINSRQRVGLVGRNGYGKTTLVRMIAGIESPDAGEISHPRNYRIGHVTQALDFSAPTVLEEGMLGLAADAAGQHWQVEKILAGLGFSPADMQCSPARFSGGFQVRLNLAKVLVSRPDMLLLDEPTNYLDIASIRWIKRFLVNWPGELLLITHDRSFMDQVVTHVVGIHRKKTRKVEGDTAKYYDQIAQEEAVYEKTRINEEKRKKEVEQFINRFRAKARLASMVQSRVKTLNKMTPKEKLEKAKTLDFSFTSRPFTGKYMLRADNLAFSYDPQGPDLISDFSITVGAGERICIVGRNGAGKTTLLRLLADDLAPRAGRIENHPNVAKTLFEQTNIKTLVDDRTVEEEIAAANPEMSRQAARNICGAMMFEGDLAFKKIKVLSGGEKCRIMLGRLLATPANFLLLDEPTNHFDMESADALLSAIDNFDGAVVMVTHNEMFLHALADRLIVFQNDTIEVFDGTYQRFLETVGWGDEAEAKPATPGADAAENLSCADNAMLSKKEYRQRRSALINEKARLLKPIDDEIAELENHITDWENELESLQQKMQAASNTGAGSKIAELSQAIHACQQNIDAAFDRLESLTAEAEQHRASFEDRLSELEAQRPF